MDPVAAAALLGTLGLYARLTPPRILAHETRAWMLDRIASAPGITIGQLVEDSRFSYNTVVYHARALERGGHVRIEKSGRSRRCSLASPPLAPPASSGEVAVGDACPPSPSAP